MEGDIFLIWQQNFYKCRSWASEKKGGRDKEGVKGGGEEEGRL
jgi:hypothetical protein